jgi:hypothetical protein
MQFLRRTLCALAVVSPLAGCFSYTHHDSDEGRPTTMTRVTAAVPTALAVTAITAAPVITPRSGDAVN